MKAYGPPTLESTSAIYCLSSLETLLGCLLPPALTLLSPHTPADPYSPHTHPGGLTQNVEGGQHLKNDVLTSCGQQDGEPGTGPLCLHRGCQPPFDLTGFQPVPDSAEDFMLAFLLILELSKVTDEDDKGTIRAAP